MADTKRRLPVLKNTPEEEQHEEPRPPWHWVGFGVVATFAAWLPLQYIAESVVQRLLRGYLGEPSSEDAMGRAVSALASPDRAKVWIIAVGLRALPLFFASFCGGYLVGRWGGDHAGVRESTVAGVATAIVVSALAFASLGIGAWWTPAMVLAITVPLSALGGKVGLTRRIRALTPNIK